MCQQPRSLQSIFKLLVRLSILEAICDGAKHVCDFLSSAIKIVLAIDSFISSMSEKLCDGVYYT